MPDTDTPVVDKLMHAILAGAGGADSMAAMTAVQVALQGLIELRRCATALERIAKALENPTSERIAKAIEELQ